MDLSKVSVADQEVLAWLGFWRDKIPLEAVESLQRIIEGHEAVEQKRALDKCHFCSATLTPNNPYCPNCGTYQ